MRHRRDAAAGGTHDGSAPVARAVVRPDGQGAPGQLAVCDAAVLPGRGWLRRAVQRRRRRTGTVRHDATPCGSRLACSSCWRSGWSISGSSPRLAWPAWLGGVVLLVLVLRIGHVGKGAQRWLELGGLQLQPSELMKTGAGAGAGLLVPPRLLGADGQSAVPDPAGDRGADPGRADPEGAEPRHRGDHRGAGRPRSSSPPACGGGSSCWSRCRSRWSRASPTRICTTTSGRGSTPS